MRTFPLKIASPDGELFKGDAVKLSVRGTEGELAVMAGHIPFVTSVKPCECRILLSDGSERTATTGGGMLNVANDKVLFLSGSFKWTE